MLAACFEREASADGAATILEVALEKTRRRRPRPAWLAGLHGGTTRRSMVLAGRASAASATSWSRRCWPAVVLGALLLAGQRGRRPRRSLPCVGDPPSLCGFGAGEWTSTSFLPGLTRRSRATAGTRGCSRPPRVQTSADDLGIDLLSRPAPGRGRRRFRAARDGTLDGLADFLGEPRVSSTAVAIRPDECCRRCPVRAFDLKAISKPSVGLLRLRPDGRDGRGRRRALCTAPVSDRDGRWPRPGGPR